MIYNWGKKTKKKQGGVEGKHEDDAGQGGIIKFASWELAAFSKYFARVSVNYKVSKPS